MTFETVSDATHAIQNFALKQGASVRVTSHGGIDRKMICTSSSCGFFVRTYRQSKTINGKRTWGRWHIASLSLSHTECTSVAKPTTRQIANFATFSSAVNMGRPVTAQAIVRHIQETDSILLQKRKTVYRAMAAVRNAGELDVLESFQTIAPYLDAFQKLNKDTIASAEKDAQGRFKRAVVVAGVFANAVRGCHAFVGLDCSHSKNKSFSGVQVHLVGRDGTLKNVTIAFGLVPAEDSESYDWFLDAVIAARFPISSIPVFCDRGNALISTADRKGLHLRFCTLHIIRNVIHIFGKLSKDQKNLIWALQESSTVEKYQSQLHVIGLALGPAVSEYLASIKPAKWCLFPNCGVHRLYGSRTSNFVESVFGTQMLTGIRQLHPFEFIKQLCEKLVSDCYERASNARVWQASGLKITPKAWGLYTPQTRGLGKYERKLQSRDVCFVRNKQQTPSVTRRVTLSTKSCTCMLPDQYGIPCCHIKATLDELNEPDRVYEFFDECYAVACYIDTFGALEVDIPIESEVQNDTSWGAPIVSKRAGRPKTKRIRSRGEANFN